MIKRGKKQPTKPKIYFLCPQDLRRDASAKASKLAWTLHFVISSVSFVRVLTCQLCSFYSWSMKKSFDIASTPDWNSSPIIKGSEFGHLFFSSHCGYCSPISWRGWYNTSLERSWRMRASAKPPISAPSPPLWNWSCNL